MSKVMDLPDDTRETDIEISNRVFVYPIGIKLIGKRFELHFDDGRV